MQMITGMLYQDTIQQKLNILKAYCQGARMWGGAIQTFDRLENSIDTLEHEARNPNVQNVKVVGWNLPVRKPH
ncbi:hypothetical protein [Acinetobacter sp. YH12200]|uniref:hypothetical protein n=1 Tax=Acinetobacter sp. YH12200 TaxID=2601139 RepID=UPI0013307E62|nr:hypothetical protein [Acinetobacter sp. YH12200]